jgi:hypothetical protein
VSRVRTSEGLPAATRRCWDCGVGSGPCQCTREFALWERTEEERQEAEEERLAYLESLAPASGVFNDQRETRDDG